jgi:hypothetical protein
MTNPISRRLDRLESEMERRTNPGYPPVFTLIDDPRDPENAQRLDDAERFRRDNPNATLSSTRRRVNQIGSRSHEKSGKVI